MAYITGIVQQQGADRCAKIVLGVVGGLCMAGIGVFWWQGRAAVENYAPPPPAPEAPAPDPEDLPVTDPGDMQGPTPPEVSDLTREEQRFFPL